MARAPIEKVFPYLMIDARYEKVRRGGEVIGQGLLLAVGGSEEGYREVLSVWVADSESEAGWGEVFSDLSRRVCATWCRKITRECCAPSNFIFKEWPGSVAGALLCAIS